MWKTCSIRHRAYTPGCRRYRGSYSGRKGSGKGCPQNRGSMRHSFSRFRHVLAELYHVRGANVAIFVKLLLPEYLIVQQSVYFLLAPYSARSFEHKRYTGGDKVMRLKGPS